MNQRYYLNGISNNCSKSTWKWHFTLPLRHPHTLTHTSFSDNVASDKLLSVLSATPTLWAVPVGPTVGLRPNINTHHGLIKLFLIQQSAFKSCLWRRVSKIAKSEFSFVMSVRLPIRPSVRTEQHGSHWTDFHEIWYLSVFRKKGRENSSFIKI